MSFQNWHSLSFRVPRKFGVEYEWNIEILEYYEYLVDTQSTTLSTVETRNSVIFKKMKKLIAGSRELV